MDGGDAGGAGVEVAAVLPGTVLDCAVGELDFAAVADGPRAAAGAVAGFEDGAVEAGFAELVGGDEAGDACAEDDDLFAFAEVRGELGRREASAPGRRPRACMVAKAAEYPPIWAMRWINARRVRLIERTPRCDGFMFWNSCSVWGREERECKGKVMSCGWFVGECLDWVSGF